MEKLLKIEPDQELRFRYELNRQVSCSIRLSNRTRDHVAFKVKTTGPEKYCVRPNHGIVLPGSTCAVIVWMQCGSSFPEDRQCKDKFQILSIVGKPVSPAAITKELIRDMFDRRPRGYPIQELKLRVVYTYPSSSTTRRLETQDSSFTLPHRNSINPQVAQELDRNESNFGDLLMKGIYLAVLGLFVCYLILKILPFIWSFTFVVTMLVARILRNLVSDSVEDWIVKCLTAVCIHFITLLFGRRGN